MAAEKESLEMTKRLQAEAEKLIAWFQREKKDYPWRRDTDPYHVWISEIMLQQTRTETVAEYYKRFTEAFPDIHSLAAADEESVLKLWEGLGYYSRARNLHRCAKIIAQERQGRFPEEAAELKKLPGIGQYTAGAIASIAFRRPASAVDGNILRILARFNNDERDILLPAVKKEACKSLDSCLKEIKEPGLFNEALMELGERICTPSGRPRCRYCPLQDACLALKEGTQEDLPLRGKNGPRRIEKKTVLMLICRGRAALIKRPEKGLLGGLYAFPMLDGHVILSDLTPWLASYNQPFGKPQPLKEASHIFTHVEWHMNGWRVETQEELPGYIYAGPDEIEGRYAIPTAFKAYREIFLQEFEYGKMDFTQ